VEEIGRAEETADFIEVGPDDADDAGVAGALDELGAQGMEARPKVICSQGVPEGMMISYEMLAAVAAAIDRVQGQRLDPQRLKVFDLGVHSDVCGNLRPILRYLSQQGEAARPVVVGRGNGPEGVLISVPLFGEIYSDIDQAQIAHTVGLRLGLIDPENFAERQLEAMCADFGVDPEEVRRIRKENPGSGFTAEPPWERS
jgi:hypothetical protein